MQCYDIFCKKNDMIWCAIVWYAMLCYEILGNVPPFKILIYFDNNFAIQMTLQVMLPINPCGTALRSVYALPLHNSFFLSSV